MFSQFLKFFNFWALGTWSWNLKRPKPLGHSREAINGLMCLKFGTLIARLNIRDPFLNFSKIFIFRSCLGHFWTKNWSETFVCTTEGMDGKCMWVFFDFLKVFIVRSYLWRIWPKIWSKTFLAHQRRHFHFVFSYSLGKCWGLFYINFLILLFLGHIWGVFGLKFGCYIF